jgi:hypothetical protein
MRIDSRFIHVLNLALLCICALAQQNAAVGGKQADRFIGRWKQNVEKSSPTPRNEIISIDAEGKRYRITREFTDHDGNRSGDWTLTDMRGSGSPLMHTDLTTTGAEWRVKRDGDDSFVVVSVASGPSAVFRIELRYTVSPDGMTLTRRIMSGGPTNHGNPVIVFDRIP